MMDQMTMIVNSIRAARWVAFAGRVAEHIDNYTVPQYGDEGADQVSNWTAEDCIKQAQKYLARFGTQARKGEEQLDLMKVAHYVQMASEKMENEQ